MRRSSTPNKNPETQPPGSLKEADRKAPPPLRHIFRVDLRSLAAFRIAISLVLLWDLWARARDLEAHYTDAGVLPRKVLYDFFLSRRPYFSVHILHGSAQFEAALFCIAAVCALALLFGYRTWFATLGCWFLTCSLHARNPLILHGGDDVLRMLLFWAIFVPLGAKWSVDSRNTRIEAEIDGVCSWGTAGLMLQLCFVYLFSGALKSHPSWRHDGTAVYLALSIDQFTTSLGRALLPYHSLLWALTFGTLALEIFGPFVALFSYESAKMRTLMALAFIGFHIALGLCIELGIFPAVCIAGWLVFLPGPAWDALERRIRPVLKGRFESFDVEREQTSTAVGTPPSRPIRVRLSLAGNVVAGVALFYIVLWNVRAGNFDRLSRFFPRRLNVIGEVARIDQFWNLFAPYPSLEHGWYVLDAHLADGTEVDLLTGRPVTWEKPPLVSATYRNERWRKYLMNLWTDDYSRYRPFYAQYLQRTWNRSHPVRQRLSRLEITFVLETALPNYALSPRKRVKLWQQTWP